MAGSIPLAYRFTGQRWDGVIRLYDYNARWYDPAIGRFIQSDSIVPEPGNPQGLNRYTYVRNNPVRYTDPSGHWLFEDDPTKVRYIVPPKNTEVGQAVGVKFVDDIAETREVSGGEFAAAITSPLWASAGAVVIVSATWDIGVPFLASGAQKAVWWLWSQEWWYASGIGQFLGRYIWRLSSNIRDTFENQHYRVRVLAEELLVYRAEGRPMGRWYGLIKPDSAAVAERLYNVMEYGNDLLQVSTYIIPKGTLIYEGPVAGGRGWQIYIPDPIADGVRRVLTEFLPQFGF